MIPYDTIRRPLSDEYSSVVIVSGTSCSRCEGAPHCDSRPSALRLTARHTSVYLISLRRYTTLVHGFGTHHEPVNLGVPTTNNVWCSTGVGEALGDLGREAKVRWSKHQLRSQDLISRIDKLDLIIRCCRRHIRLRSGRYSVAEGDAVAQKIKKNISRAASPYGVE